ncbi:hypothetical protein [Egbenema bharatensis]
MSSNFDRLLTTITDLVLCQSPSGAEAEIDRLLLQQFQALNMARSL